MADLHAAWPILLPLAFAMVTCVLGTITRHQMHQRASHDLIRQTKQLPPEDTLNLPAGEVIPGNISLERLRELGI